jgi:hypothetical protein
MQRQVFLCEVLVQQKVRDDGWMNEWANEWINDNEWTNDLYHVTKRQIKQEKKRENEYREGTQKQRKDVTDKGNQTEREKARTNWGNIKCSCFSHPQILSNPPPPPVDKLSHFPDGTKKKKL